MKSLPMFGGPNRLARPWLAGLLAAAIVAFGVSVRRSRAQEVPAVSPVSVQSNQQIFSTMCALDAAGFDADASTLGDMPARLALRQQLLRLQGPATDAIRKFYRDHQLASSTETLTPFMTFALVSGAPPVFNLPDREVLPPSVLTIDGFQPLLSDFYREARLSARWSEVEPEAQPMIVSFRTVVRHIVTVSDGYLRELEKPSRRTFTVYVEPLVGARTNFRNTGDAYAIVVGSLADASVDTIQHAYLHYKLDPMVLRYRPVVDTKRALLPVAARAPQLPVEYHDDFVSFMDECVIKAVELRLRRLSADRLEAELKNNDQAGFILVRPLVAQLQKFEKDAPAMSYYFPTLITGIDVPAEQKRAQGIAFAAADAVPVSSDRAAAEPPSQLEKWIVEGNRQIAEQDAAGAAATFQAAFDRYPNDPRVVYGLAIASVLSGHARRARDLFEELVAAKNSAPSANAPDPSILAWSHVYLGRIDDLQDERELAVNEYHAALAVPGAPEAARVAALAGVESAYKPPERPADSQQPEQ